MNNRWLERYPKLIEDVLERSTRPQSVDHGARHWQLVVVTGSELIAEVPEADPDVVFCFGLFHDSMRENDYVDPGHGARGAELAKIVLPSYELLTDAQLEQLIYACEHHTSAQTSGDPTIGVCWDSDRLNLWRVAIEPDPFYMSTDPARRPECITWAEDLQDQDFTWAEICERFQRG